MITSFKLFENVEYSKKILNSLEIPLDNEDYLKLKSLLVQNPGYLGKFTEWMFRQDIKLDQLKSLYNDIRGVKLDKEINSFKTPEELYDYITELKIQTKVNQVLKSLPSRTRDLVNKELTNLINLNIKYSDNIKDFYSKKGGRYKNIKDLLTDTKSLIKNLTGGWSVKSIKYSPEELVYKDNHTLILHINSYSRSKKLGSPHWCISTDEYQWDNYTKDFNKQYFIYDFSKDISDNKSMIGVTVGLNGSIVYAHLRNDNKANVLDLNIYSRYLLPYSKDYIKSRVDLNDIIKVSKYGLTDEVKRLIDSGIDPSDMNNGAIRLASLNGHHKIVELLLRDSRVDPSDGNNFAIKLASQNGHHKVVELLLKDSRVDPSNGDNYAIKLASQYGHHKIVELLMRDSRVDPSTNDNDAIIWASLNGHHKVVELLLKDSRVDPSADNNYTIRYSSSNGHLKVVELLLRDSRVDPSDMNNYAIKWASLNGHHKVVELLMRDKRAQLVL